MWVGSSQYNSIIDMENNPIILVMYIAVGNMDFRDVAPYVEHIANITKPFPEDTIKKEIYYIPVYDSKDSRIECINPKLLTEEEFEEARGVLNEVKNKFELWQAELEGLKSS